MSAIPRLRGLCRPLPPRLRGLTSGVLTCHCRHMVLGTTATRHREEIADLCDAGSDTEKLFETVSRRLRTIVPYTGSTWFATDPATLLATRPVYIENIEPGHCTT